MACGRPHRRSGRCPRPRGGFTLLEVLAAILILMMWLVVIVSSAMQGVRAEGVSRRRLEAASIADRAMAALEAASVGGSVPEITNDVYEEGDYTISVTVAPFVEAPRRGAPAAPPVLEEGEVPDLELLLGTELQERSADLRVLEVQVAWQEGFSEMSVSRTSFAFDLETAVQAWEAAGFAPSGDAGGDAQAGQPPDGGGAGAPEEDTL